MSEHGNRELAAAAGATTRPCYVISLANTKGGAGKSTTAMALLGAVNDAEPDATAMALDLDPQRTLNRFVERRKQKGYPSDWLESAYADDAGQMSPEHVFELVEALRAGYNYVLIDTAGHSKIETIHFCLLSDLVIIPADLNMGELEDSVIFYNDLKESAERAEVDLNARFLIARHSPSIIDNHTKKVAAFFLELGLPRFRAELHDWYCFRHMFDLAMTVREQAQDQKERKGTLKALRALYDLWGEIRELRDGRYG